MASQRVYWHWRQFIGSDKRHSMVGVKAISKWITTTCCKPGPFFSALTRRGRDAVRYSEAWTSRMQLLQCVHSRTLLRAVLFSSAVGLQHLLCSGPGRVLCRGRVGATSSSRLLPVQRVQDKQLQFNWGKLWEMLSPDLLLLTLAVLVK